MSNCISYALFDIGKQDGCFEINSYVRGFMFNIRLARLLYPDWKVILHIDGATKQKFPILDDLFRDKIIHIIGCEPAPLTKAMLWRMKPVFERSRDGFPIYEHVICRDLDSPLTYKERLCVQQWIDNGKAAHAITDSVSHDMPMMGGMIGFLPKNFTEYTGIEDFDNLCKGGYSFENKGADQILLSEKIYPCFSRKGHDSITQHYLQGYGQTWLSDWHNTVPEIDLKPYGIPDEMREAWANPHQGLGGHIGCAGHYSPATENFLRKYREQFKDIFMHETKYPDLFYWVKTGEI